MKPTERSDRESALLSDDGSEDVSTEAERAFVQWLLENGATYPKLEWPSRATVNGVRGAMALEDISPLEPMLCIPESLMITPPLCKSCAALSEVYNAHSEFFLADEDHMLTLFMMYERLRGAESFWHPFFEILPRPSGVADWSDDEKLELQDRELVASAARRTETIRKGHRKLIDLAVATCGAERFPESAYTLELYRWAWMSIQARAFGRRLPWTALVPFADCLNHSNVQTKYDFHVNGNGLFRLFPSGNNSYAKGCEAFNSYGRRTNRFLLIEYGFALDNNEWDGVEVMLRLAEDQPLYEQRRKLMRECHLSTAKMFRIHRRSPHLSMIGFCRMACLNEDELAAVRDAPDSRQFPINLRNEAAALEMLLAQLRGALESFATSLDEDERLLAAPGVHVRLLSALRYRVAKKRVIAWHMSYCEAFLGSVSAGETPEVRLFCSSGDRRTKDQFLSYNRRICTLQDRAVVKHPGDGGECVPSAAMASLTIESETAEPAQSVEC